MNERPPIFHIFRGIPDGLMITSRPPEQNLEVLGPHFKRLGITIGNETRIENSSLEFIVQEVNRIVTPEKKLDMDAFDEKEKSILESPAEVSGDTRRSFDLSDQAAREKKYFLTIGDHVTIGGEVSISIGCEIGDGVTIGDKTILAFGVKIGKGAKIGKAVFLGNFSRIGEEAVLDDGAALGADAEVPPRAHVKRDEKTGRVIVSRRLRSV